MSGLIKQFEELKECIFMLTVYGTDAASDLLKVYDMPESQREEGIALNALRLRDKCIEINKLMSGQDE